MNCSNRLRGLCRPSDPVGDESVTQILNITAPIFLLILIGYGAVRAGILAKENVRYLGVYTLNFALPALVFKALAQRPLVEVLNGSYLLIYRGASILSFVAIYSLSRWAFGRPGSVAGLQGMGAAASNSGFIGYPVAAMVVGPTAVVAMALNMIVENGIIIPLAIALAEAGLGQGRGFRAVWWGAARTLVRNPLIIAIAAGMALSLTGLALPGPVAKAIDMMAVAAAPVALFVVGGSLVGLSIRGELASIGMVAAGKLLLHPLLVVAGVLLIDGLAPDLRRAAIVFAACPMLTIYPLFGLRFGQQDNCAAILVVTTGLSFITLSALLLWV